MRKDFIEWLRLDETVNLNITDYERNDAEATRDISSLGWWLMGKLGGLAKNSSSQIAGQFITPDGIDDDYKQSGTLNFYHAGLNDTEIQKIEQGIKFYLDELKVKYGQFIRNKSNLINSNVTRIPILQMMVKKSLPPELNITERTAEVVFKNVLGLVDLENISARDLLVKIEYVEKQDITQNTSEPKTTTALKGPTFYDGGYDEARIKSVLDRAKAVAQWAIANGYETLSIY